MMPDPLSEAFPRAARELQALQQSIQPEAGFAQRLEERLTERPAQVLLGQHTPARPRFALPRLNLRQPAWAVAFVILLVLATAILAIGPQKVLAEVERLIGYLPGIGFVDDTERVLILDGPVQVERDGVVVTIKNAVADGQSTRMDIHVEGVHSKVSDAHLDDSSIPRLLLPTAEELSTGGGNSSSWHDLTHLIATSDAQYSFAPLPENVDQVVLVMEVLPGMARGETVENWRIPLRFRPPQKGDQLNQSPPVEWRSATRGGMTLVLDRVSQTADSTFLRLRFESTDPRVRDDGRWAFDNIFDHELTLIDQHGKQYPLTMETVPDRTGYIFSTLPIPEGERLTIRLSQIDISTSFPQDDSAPGFTFDPGADMQLNQTWSLDQDIRIGKYHLKLDSASLDPVEQNAFYAIDGEQVQLAGGLDFHFAPQPGVTSMYLRCVQPVSCADGVGGFGKAGEIFVNVLGLTEFPNQPMTIKFSEIRTTLQGPWEIHWEVK